MPRFIFRVSRLLLVGLVAGSLTHCASVNSVSLTQIPVARKKTVTATSSKLVFFAFNFDNDYVDEVSRSLRSQCKGGKVEGILTKDETILYFLFFVWKRQVTATGYCNKA